MRKLHDSETLSLLLNVAKAENPDFSWRSVAKALADLYHPDMSLEDVISVVVNAYEKALAEPRFEISTANHPVTALMLSPIKGAMAIGGSIQPTPETNCSIEEFYNAMIGHLMSQLRIANVGWVINPETNSPQGV